MTAIGYRASDVDPRSITGIKLEKHTWAAHHFPPSTFVKLKHCPGGILNFRFSPNINLQPSPNPKMTTRKALTDPVQALLKALKTTPLSMPNILKTFTTDPTPLIYEHGLPQLAPFLGRPFTGAEGVTRYFEILGETLSIEDMSFEEEDMWVVDCSNFAVSLRGKGRFAWKGDFPAQAWDETFIYRVQLAVDLVERGLRVSEYRVWADTGAAYLSRCGKLRGEVEHGVDGDGDDEGEGSRRQDVLGNGLNVYGSCG